MRVSCPALSPLFHPERCETARIRRKRRHTLALTLLILLAASPDAIGGSVVPVLPPPPDNFALDSIPTIAAQSSFTYSFSQGAGPLAKDFDDTNLAYASRTNTTPLTTAQYIFNGALLDKQQTLVSAQWSPASNLTGCFVPFLGFDARGNELDNTIGPTTVAKITDDKGKTYGYIIADYNSTSEDNTTFTIVNTSKYALDPTITGEQVGITLPEQFTSTAPTVSPTSGTSSTNGTLTYGAAMNVAGGGFNVSGISATTNPGQASTLTLTATEGFKVSSTSATNTLTMTAGSVTVTSNAFQSTFGGSGSVSAQAIITDTTTNKQLTPITLAPFTFTTTKDLFQPQTFHFNTTSASQALSLNKSDTYSAQVKWTVTYTPNAGDNSFATLDPNIILYNQPLVATPAPPTWVLAVIAVVCVGSFQLISRRMRSRPSCPLAA